MLGQSTFCAEPGGHNLIRKGVVDAALNGCIPIVFLQPDEYRRLWPHHLFGWRDEAMLNIPPSAMLDRKLDLVAHLKAIPTARVQQMQRAARSACTPSASRISTSAAMRARTPPTSSSRVWRLGCGMMPCSVQRVGYCRVT